MKKSFLASALTIGLVGFSGVAQANPQQAVPPPQPQQQAAPQQAAPQQAVPQQQPAEQASFDESELKSFASAVSDVSRIEQTYLQKLESAAADKEKEQIQQQASQEMVQAVEKQGFTVKEYNEMFQTVLQNPALAEQVKQMME